MASNPFEELGAEEKKELFTKWSPSLESLVQQEVSKILRNKQAASAEIVNFAQMKDYDGNIALKPFSLFEKFLNLGIVDTWATNHICAVQSLFVNLKPLSKRILIHLPDGTTKDVTICSNIHSYKSLTLQNALYLPSFKHNLLSVS